MWNCSTADSLFIIISSPQNKKIRLTGAEDEAHFLRPFSDIYTGAGGLRMDLDTNIRELKGIGEKTAALFARLQLFTVGDLIRYFPRTYETYEAPVPVREAVGGEIQAFRCRILAAPSLKKIRNLIFSVVFSGTENWNSPVFSKKKNIKSFKKKFSLLIRLQRE